MRASRARSASCSRQNRATRAAKASAASAIVKVLERFYPQLAEVRLTDFKVRVLDGNRATEAKVRVLIESTDGRSIWTTVGVSTDIIEASWFALVDSIEYHLARESGKK